MEKYELVDLVNGDRFELVGISLSQKDCFSYRINSSLIMDVHTSHLNVDCAIVYDKKYRLTNDDIAYFYKDLGGL